MPIDSYIKAIIACSKGKHVEGKKRLQKLVFLLNEAGFPAEAKFFLKDYGPFSRDVESASDFMALFGEIVEKPASVGYSNYMTTLYSLPEDEEYHAEFEKGFLESVQIFDNYKTVELEIASTIRFFELQGLSFDRALNETREMKPSKSTQRVIDRAREILSHLPVRNAPAANP